MATVNSRLGKNYPGNYEFNGANDAKPALKRRYHNCATDNLASGEYYTMFAVPANSIIRSYAWTETVEGAAETLDVIWIAVTDTTAASGVSMISNHTLETDDTCSTGTVIAQDAAGYVCVKPDAALTVGKFNLVIEIIPMSNND